MRKEVPQSNEMVNQARSKYFPSSQAANGAQPSKIKLARPSSVSVSDSQKQYATRSVAAAGHSSQSSIQSKDYKKLLILQLQQQINHEDDNFEEPPDQRALPNFLQNLPGVTATDSMGYRIEALRVYLE